MKAKLFPIGIDVILTTTSIIGLHRSVIKLYGFLPIPTTGAKDCDLPQASTVFGGFWGVDGILLLIITGLCPCLDQ